MHFLVASQNTLSMGFYCQTQIKDTYRRLQTIAQYVFLGRGSNHLLNIPFWQLKRISLLDGISVEQAQKTIKICGKKERT